MGIVIGGGAAMRSPVSGSGEEAEMIVRTWSGHTTASGGQRYVAYFRNILLPKLQRLDGHRGAMGFTRGEGEEVEVNVLTFWDSMVSIRGFAGADPAAAVVEPEAEALLKRFDARVKHFEVLVDARA